jgi:hypothetical protein
VALDPTRRAQLNLAKLKALATSAGATGLTPLGFPGGAAASGDGTLWVFSETLGVALLGGALSVALKGDVPERLVVITDSRDDAAVMARRAEYFASPATIDVHFVDGTTLACAELASLSDGNYAHGLDFEVPAGVEAVREHGVTSFEVRGLEIGRIEDGVLAVGVGKHDREAHRMAGSEATLESLAARIRNERRHDAPGSAATSYARERWLRSIVVAKPEIIGLAQLTPVAPPLPRQDLRAVSIAPAIGAGDKGSVVVAFSVGVDPDVVPSAADVRAMHAPDAELVLVVPEADALPNTRRLSAALKQPARIVTVPDTWPALGD